MIRLSFFIAILTLFQQHCYINSALIGFPTENNIDNGNTKLSADIDENKAIIVIPTDEFSESSEFSIEPLGTVNMDYGHNALLLKFRRHSGQDVGVDKTRRAIDNNFMRFGRSGNDVDLNKRQIESYVHQQSVNANVPNDRYERSNSRGSRGDSFLRLGRSSLMRFGRSNNDNLMRFGRTPENLMRFGRSNNENLMRFGRANNENLMRFGRSDNLMRFGRDSSLMRFGRNDNLMRFGRPDNLIRFGRQDNLMRFGRQDNLMRFGRQDNLMRFGRSSNENLMRFGRANNENLMRFGRNDKSFMRFGKLDQNFMRFGKRSEYPTKNSISDKITENKMSSNETITENESTTKNNLLNKIFKSDASEANSPEEDFDVSSEALEYIPEY